MAWCDRQPSNSTFANNTGGFAAWGDHRIVNMLNCIITDNTVLNSDAPDSAIVLTRCILWNTPPGTGYSTASTDVIELDPMLGNDLHILAGSPAIDAGNDAFLGAGDTTDLDGENRFHDGNGDQVPTVDLGCFEFQGSPGIIVAAFAVADQTSGSSLVTDTNTVDVSITLEIPEGLELAACVVSQADVEPEWPLEATVPTTYTFEPGTPEGDVTLYAWAKDSEGNVNKKSAAILYSTAVPVVSNVVVTAGDPGSGTAAITWDTDITALGGIRYKAMTPGASDVVVHETAVGTSHSVVMTGLVDGMNYRIVVVNNEREQPAIYWPQLWPIAGDANGDCRVNILDLIFIRNRLNQDINTGDNIKADVNLDGRINILDLIYVRNRLNTACP